MTSARNETQALESPVASSSLKRKPPAAIQTPSKRQKSSGTGATADPARAYCLKKLQEVFSQIFLRYPFIHSDDDGGEVAEKLPEHLTEAQKEHVEETAKLFAIGLEQCVYDIYSELDAKGKPSAGGKYK